MGKSESFDFHNIDGSSSMNVSSSNAKSGCFVSTVTGFVLTLLAACLAVGVGLIVHFSGSNASVDCKCSYPGADSGAIIGGVTTPKPSTAKPIQDQCKELIQSGSSGLCKSIYSPILRLRSFQWSVKN